MKSLQVAQTPDPENQSDRTDQVSDKSIVIPNKHVTIADSIKSEHSRYCQIYNPIYFMQLKSQLKMIILHGSYFIFLPPCFETNYH